MLCNSCSTTTEGTGLRKTRTTSNKNGMGYTVVIKLLETGGYLNKVFVNNSFMSVPLVRHLQQLSTYNTGTVRRNTKLLPQQFKNKSAVGQQMHCRSGPLLTSVFRERKSQKKSCHSSLQPCQSPRGSTGRRGNPQIKRKIITYYNKIMGSINSSDMMLYTYLDERWTACYWKNVAFNTIARMVLNSYIFYKVNYRGPGKLKSRYNYAVSIIGSLGEEWLALKDNAGVDDPRGP
jgi:hypothetical protein